jgi:hypothetical protein
MVQLCTKGQAFVIFREGGGERRMQDRGMHRAFGTSRTRHCASVVPFVLLEKRKKVSRAPVQGCWLYTCCIPQPFAPAPQHPPIPPHPFATIPQLSRLTHRQPSSPR